jgi:alpha-L-fucosidase
LLDVGPEADGTIPPVQMERLRALGAWLHQNGEAIYGTEPWTRAVGQSKDGIGVRFTQKHGDVFAILMGTPKQSEITLVGLAAKPGTAVHLLGYGQPLKWTADAGNLKVTLPASLPGKYAYVLQLKPVV